MKSKIKKTIKLAALALGITAFATNAEAALKTPYNITIESSDNGSVETEPIGEATVDATVTIYPSPYNGYVVDSIKVWKTGDNATKVTVDSDGKFSMPAYNVTVLVKFKAAPVNVSYVDVDGTTKQVYATVVGSDEENRVTWNEGWYVVDSDVEIPMGVNCSGEVNLILADGAKLTIDEVDEDSAGIRVPGGGNSLVIYGQAAGTGALDVTGGAGGAGIGGDNDEDGANITINGGTVTASGGSYASGIGGGYGGNGSNITINGGSVTVNGGSYAAGIGGGGNSGNGSDIIINGGTVTATGGSAGIGGGAGGDASNIKAADSVIIKAGNAPNPTTVIEHTSTTDLSNNNNFKGKKYVTAVATVKPATVEVSYLDAEGQTQTTNAIPVLASDTRVTWNEGWYVVTNEVAIPKGADCSGAVNLILADTGKLTISGVDMLKAGIKVSGDNDSLVIYGQTAGTGTLNVAGDSDVGGAGIGGGGGVDGGGVGSNITINGGTVNATGGNASAGIGGRCDYGCSNIVINAGMVIAKGGINAAGIGGGLNGNGSYITINGGTVTATSGGDNGAGIGGGGAINGYGSYIYINGGTVTANGGASASGIGGGNCGGASDIYVADYVILRADGNNPPMTEITHTSGQDISSSLTGQRYATAVTPIEVAYVDADGKTQTTNAIPVLASDTRAAWIEGWYVVNSDVKIPMGVYCSGAVNLILADGAKLTIDGMDDNDSGIGVTGVNSLAIYGQSAGTGTLNVAGGSGCAGIGGNATSNGSGITINGGVVTATGGDCAAGIGGGYYGSGSNIVINAGTVTANGTNGGAGIGGGYNGAGSNITINGGTVTANGGEYAAGIGGGESGSASYIYVADNIVLKADGSNPPTTVITHTSIKDDISSLLAGKQYVTAVATVKVSYLDAEGQTQTTNAIPVLASGTRVTWDAGWYVVTNEVTVTGGAECTNAVHLILADGAKLTIDGVDMSKAGIKVTGDNSLAIYGQAQGTGALDVTGGMLGAGIGGGNGGAAQNITINGGMVTAKGGKFAAGIGGGFNGNGSYITINGGVVTANGGANAVGIGGGAGGDASNIKAADSVIIKAGNSQNPTTVIAHDSTTDLSNDNNFSGKQYVTAEMLPTEPIVATPTAVENATFEVYTNGFLSAEVESGKWAAWSNRTAKVVYTAKAGYMFVDGSTVFTNDLNTAVNPAVNKDGKNPGPAIYTCKHVELEAGQSTNLVEHFTFTAAPATAFGGVFKVSEGATLTGTNVVFKGNEANNGGGAIYNYKGTVSLKDTAFMGNKARNAGGAIVNSGTLSLGGVTFEGNAAPTGGAIYNISGNNVHFDGPVTLKTASDTIFNRGTLNWNLAGGKAGCLNGYQNVTNDSTKAVLQLTVEEYTTLPTNIVIATGDFSNIATAGTDTFSITNATVGGGTVTAKINGNMILSADGLTGYKLVTEEVLSVPTTNLVLQITQYTCKREVLKDGQSTNLVAGVYTAAPTMDKGGAFSVNGGATLTGKNVVFTGNETNYGGAICNTGTVSLKNASFMGNQASPNGGAILSTGTLSLDGVTFEGNTALNGGAICNGGKVNFDGSVTLVKATDTIFNKGTLNWNLADGKAGVLNGYDKLTNSSGTLLLTVEDYAAPTNIVFATGDFTDVEGKDTFSITNIDQQVAAITGVKIGDAMILSADGLTGYKLVTEEVLSVPTTNLVLQVTQYTCARTKVTPQMSPYVLEEGKTYTAAPMTGSGGAFCVNSGATLTGKNVVFTGNEAKFGGAINNFNGTVSLGGVTFEGNVAEKDGGAIYNYSGTVNLDGPVTLKTESDTIHNQGTLNWKLAGGKASCLSGYQNITNDYSLVESGAIPVLQLTVEEYTTMPTNFVIATGDFTSVSGKDTFTVTNVTTGASFTLKIGDPTTYLGDYAYSLAVTGDSTNRQLVFTVGYGQFAVDFNANGGVHTNGLEIVTGDCFVKTGYEFPKVTREGYTFKGWYDSWTNNAKKVTSPTPLLKYAEHTLYAQWTSKATTISTKGELYLPDLVSGKPVTNVVKGAYNKNKKLKTLVTSLYLKEIGEYAFSGCSQLKSVTINATRNYEDNMPTPLTIARNAFSGCAALEEVYISGEVTDLGQSAFQGCAKLKKIVFAGTNTVTVGSSAFARCGYNNGEGKIYVYMSQEFRDNNSDFLAALDKWFVKDGVELVRKVDATPATGVATIDVDFSKLGTDRKLAVMIKTNVTGKPDVRTVDIQYRASLEAGDWTTLKADSKTAFAGGSVLVEITVPDGNSGFLRAITVKEEN